MSYTQASDVKVFVKVKKFWAYTTTENRHTQKREDHGFIMDLTWHYEFRTFSAFHKPQGKIVAKILKRKVSQKVIRSWW